MRIPAFSLCLLMIGLILGPVPAAAQTSIEVVVNDQPITTYDIKQRARLIQLTARKNSSVARHMAEQELIDDVLKMDEAKRVGIVPSSKEIDNAFASIARNVKMSPSQLSTALRKNGVNPSTLKDRLKVQIAWQKTVGSRFRSQIKIEESQVIAALKKSDIKDKNTSVEYDLSQIIVVVPKKASSSLKAKRQRESAQIRKEFNGCDAAGTLLGQFNEVVLKPVGRRLETELPAAMKDDITGTEVGRLTKPQKTGRGFEMIAVCGKREMASDLSARTEMENQLREKKGEQLMRRYLQELKLRATIVQR
ncbi:peptidylprolyl isomerase [uncultured Roseibium sp.]|uniref:peptidylprolyl isomerase n=1 Tax=uncultured Roseibium sp. TaxID=1936171 RepID=UPI00321786C2